ncbi:ABC-three component system protein [Flavobacterium sp. ST-87]|uniref:ABC-three component system protein n=1 Tax=Flavobacterium plantiphilum TaxID=3163297 RepID=A0ABW8XV04_9FLAO
MARDFDYLLKKHGKEGSRSVFEDACAKAFSAKYKGAFPIKCNPGDEGIDVYIGDFSKPIDVYQCKCFFNEIEEVQKTQIRASFKKAIESKSYKMKKWCLCVPKSLTIDETNWWTTWSNSIATKHKIEIELFDQTKLLRLIKETDIHLEIFDEKELQLLTEILTILETKEQRLKEIFSVPEEIDYNERIFSLKLKSANINENLDVYNKQFFNAEILTKEVQSKGIEDEIKELISLKNTIQELWLTQYLMYDDETDGNKLLGMVNMRIEDQNNTNLKTVLSVGSTEKKGILHQLADECTVGWVKKYKERLKDFIEQNDRTTGKV